MAEAKEKAELFLKNWDSGQTFFEVKTSGSTGPPRSILLSRSAMEASALITGRALQIRNTDSIHCCLPVEKTAGFMQLVRSRVWQIPIVVDEPSKNPLLNGARGNIVSLTPMQLHAVMHNPVSADILNLYRIVLVGGGDIHTKTEKMTAHFRPVFYHTYGMTETCSHIALRKLNDEKVFHTLPGIETGLNSDGCLTICGTVTDGAVLHTRDMARFENGGFVILGRVDFVINSGGIKIHPEMIEKIIENENQIPENSIIIAGKKDAEYGEIPVLLVNKKLVQNAVKTELNYPEKYAKPRAQYLLEDFVYTDTGKINRAETLNLFNRTSVEQL